MLYMFRSSKNINLQQYLKMKWPLMLAPMAGGPGSSDLIATVSESGGLGCLGAAYLNAKAIDETVIEIRNKTKRPFSINLFLPQTKPTIKEEMIQEFLKSTAIYRQELKIDPPSLQAPFEEDFDDQFDSVLKAQPIAFSFTFGVLHRDYVKEIQRQKILAIGTATTIEEALQLQDSQIDAIVLQGFEAGGHRGIFNPSALDSETPLKDLMRFCQNKIKIPTIAAGGIMNREHIHNALSSGASLVQMGTAFLACREAGTSNPYRKKLLESTNRKTKMTRVFSGRLARGIENRFMKEMDKQNQAILPFPIQNKLTRDIRAAASSQENADLLSLWSGTGEGDLWTGSAYELIENLFLNSKNSSK